MTDSKDINPTYVDGEPKCSREDCTAFHRSGWEQYEPSTCEITGYSRMHDCTPALRRDRDMLHDLIIRISAVTYAGEAYPISHEDELWMELIARTWKEKK